MSYLDKLKRIINYSGVIGEKAAEKHYYLGEWELPNRYLLLAVGLGVAEGYFYRSLVPDFLIYISYLTPMIVGALRGYHALYEFNKIKRREGRI
jgi:hypothetical protein